MAQKKAIEGVYRKPPPERKRTMNSAAAAVESERFHKTASAFVQWVATEKGISPEVRLSQEEWDPFITEFFNRPIFGHRRGPEGGNHRINDRHRR